MLDGADWHTPSGRLVKQLWRRELGPPCLAGARRGDSKRPVVLTISSARVDALTCIDRVRDDDTRLRQQDPTGISPTT